MEKLTYKLLAEQLLKEYGDLSGGFNIVPNNAVGGIVNPGFSHFSSPNVSQNLDSFANNHPTMHYPVGQNKVDMFNNYKATGPDDEDVEALKKTVTPDEVLLGLQYEMKRQFHKNKSKAKAIVVKNLKSNPEYYSKLNMLQMGDERIDENKDEDMNNNIEETKKILEDMINARKNLNDNMNDEKVMDAFKDSVEKRKTARGIYYKDGWSTIV